MRAWVYLGIFAMMLGPVAGWCEVNFADLLAGKMHPLSITLKEMGPEWRVFELAGGENQLVSFFTMMAHAQSGQEGSNSYFTRGEVAAYGGETFLVAYRVETAPFDFQGVMEGEAEIPEVPITPDTVATLSLLNLRMIGGLESIRPFDLEEEMKKAEEARLLEMRGAVISSLRQLALGTQMYAQDNDGQYPPLDTEAEMQAALLPYLGGADEMFIDPMSGEPFQPNIWLSKKFERDVPRPSEMAVLYQKEPGPDGMLAVGFADGSAKFVDAAEWEKIREASGIE